MILNKNLIIEKTRNWLSLEQEGLELYSNQEFISWINISNEHKKIFEEEQRFRQSIRNLSQNYKEKKHKEIKKELKIEKTLSKLYILTPLAACFLLAIFMFIFNQQENIYTNKIYSNNKIIQDIILPDHSKITLDAKSSIEILYKKNTREVFLQKGKAVFEVSSNKNRPFYVKSNSILVQVVGTKFEVNKKERSVIISVLEGIVSIKYGQNTKSRILALLEKGDSLDISNQGKINSLNKINIEKIAMWKSEKLIFEQTPLIQVINNFSKYLNKDIDIQLNNKDTYPITGEFGVYEFNKFLDYLPLIYPINIDKKEDNLIILENNS